MNPTAFVQAIQSVALENVFNPYAERCGVFDVDDAPHRRSAVLLSILASASAKDIDSIWIGRDLGHRGGRRTGLALTDDIHLGAHGKRWEISIERATQGAPVAERTAAVIWDILSVITSNVFLWNVFPFHPHIPDDPFTNRPHNARERKIGEDLMDHLIALIRPARIVAVGNDAARTAERLRGTREVFCVRHPSYGGQVRFLQQVTSLYQIPALGRSDRRAPESTVERQCEEMQL